MFGGCRVATGALVAFATDADDYAPAEQEQTGTKQQIAEKDFHSLCKVQVLISRPNRRSKHQKLDVQSAFTKPAADMALGQAFDKSGLHFEAYVGQLAR